MIPTSDPIIHGYRTPKRGEAQVTCQDFWIRNLSLKPVAEAKPMPRRPQWTEPWAGTLHRIRLGIADGASTTFCAGMWAEALSAAAAESQEAWNNPARFNGMLAGLRNIWRTQVLRTLPDPLPWNVETALNNGAWSTVLRVTVLRRKWEAEGWGDSCLFHLRRGHRLRMVPHLLPRDFSDRPDLVSSVGTLGDKDLPQKRFAAQGELEAGDVLLLATDALAGWLAGRQDWPAVMERILGLEDEAAFSDWIEELRDRGGLHNDDTTLVVARFP